MLPGASFLEQQGATLGFQIPKRTLSILQEQGYLTSKDMLNRIGKTETDDEIIVWHNLSLIVRWPNL